MVNICEENQLLFVFMHRCRPPRWWEASTHRTFVRNTYKHAMVYKTPQEKHKLIHTYYGALTFTSIFVWYMINAFIHWNHTSSKKEIHLWVSNIRIHTLTLTIWLNIERGLAELHKGESTLPIVFPGNSLKWLLYLE